MSERIDQEGRNAFVQTLPRKVTELRATLGTLVADPRSQRMREELRRRLNALYTLTRSFNLPTLSDGLHEGIAHLDAVRSATVLSNRDLETLADLIATLPALAQRDLPDQAELFQRRAAFSAPGPSSAATGVAGSGAAQVEPPAKNDRAARAQAGKSTIIGMPAPRPPVRAAGAAVVPVGVLVVGGSSTAQEVKRALPPEADVVSVRTLSEAVTAARDTAPDLLIAECAAPADGLGLLAALRGDPLTDFLPVLLLATPNDGVDTDRAREQGASDVLLMPVEGEKIRAAVEKATHNVLQPSMPPPAMGEMTLEELTNALTEEFRKGLIAAAGPRAGKTRVPLGQGSEVLAVTWEAIARVREVVEKKTRGRVRFEAPAAPLGTSGTHVLSISDDEELLHEQDSNDGEDPLPGRRALVVDDDPSVVASFTALLRDAGMEVLGCGDGVTALREARGWRPDVLISDILMPGLDGFALTRAIRRDVVLRHTPVVLLSWKEDLLHRMRELGAQAEGFLRKEARGEAILSRVRSVLRPRVRLLRRMEGLQENEELRGRVERIGVCMLLESGAKYLKNATVVVTDSFSITEIELREGTLVSVVRTAQDGSLVRGESALLQVLGTTNARFNARHATHKVRANVQGDTTALLAGGAALISALEDSVSGAGLLEVATVELDGESALAYARSLPSAMKVLVERVAAGESPRNMVLKGGVAPQELEPLLVELARRGVIHHVQGPDGQDLVAPRLAEVGIEPPLRKSVAPPPTTPEPAPEAKATKEPESEEKKPSWKPPSNADEAAKPGFGIEAEESDSLAGAVLRELSGVAARTRARAETPESKPVVQEPARVEVKAAETPKEEKKEEKKEEAKVEAAAPAKAEEKKEQETPAKTQDEKKEKSEEKEVSVAGEERKEDFSGPHRRRVTTSSASIIIDAEQVGAPVEVHEPSIPPPKETDDEDADRSERVRYTQENQGNPLIFALGILALGVLSFFGMRFYLQSAEPTPAPVSHGTTHSVAVDAAPEPVPAPPPTPPTPTAQPDVNAPAVESPDAAAPAVAPSEQAATATVIDPTEEQRGLLREGQGLLLIEGEAEGIVFNNRDLGTAPRRDAVDAVRRVGLTYRRGSVTGFVIVDVEAGRVTRVLLPPRTP